VLLIQAFSETENEGGKGDFNFRVLKLFSLVAGLLLPLPLLCVCVCSRKDTKAFLIIIQKSEQSIIINIT